MIHKVYTARCTYCHDPLPDPKSSKGCPHYFLNVDSVFLAMADAGWEVVNGMHICTKCSKRVKAQEL